jgi:septum formation protein
MTTLPSTPPPPLVLASASPRRRELLAEAGYVFDVIPADINEDDFPPGILPADLAQELAGGKAGVVSELHPDRLVLAADTVVAFGDRILNKPRDAAHAREMLALLAGTTHIVITGVALMHRNGDFQRITRVMSAVHMRPMTDGDIERYVATDLWQGKAGGYGIQDRDPFVRRLAGEYTNIVGLPMKTVARLLAEAGVPAPIRK